MKDLSFLKNNKIAHRGIYDNVRIYENTVSAFKRAIKYKYTIEMDLRMLSDGTIVVYHDKDLERLLHVEQDIEKISYDELVYLAKYQVPTFEEVLKLIDGKVPLLIEVKTKSRKYILENKIASILDNYKGLFAIQSFNYKTVKWFYKKRKDWIVGFLIGKKNYKKEFFHKKYDFINIDAFIFSDKKIRKLREDKTVIGYTVSDKETYDKKIGAYDNLVLDNILEIDKR